MSKQTSQNRELFKRTLASLAIGLFSVAAILGGIFMYYGGSASAATMSTVNFQARLEGAGGSIAADGLYNIRFKLYSASSGGSALWTEAYYDANGVTAGQDNRVQVTNGYVSVALGSQTTFSGINWDQSHWVTMDIGGTTQTATPTYDGEMAPRLGLTATPYAFTAGQLVAGNGTLYGTLSIIQPTVGNQNFQIADQAAAGTYQICIQNSTACGFALTSGGSSYIQNQNAGVQTTSNFWISGTGRADTGILTPAIDVASAGTLSIGNATATTINIGNNAAAHTVNIATGAAVQTVTIGSQNSTSHTVIQGGTTGISLQVPTGGTIGLFQNASLVIGTGVDGTVFFKPLTNSVASFTVQDASGAGYFNVDTVNNLIQTGATTGLSVGSAGVVTTGGLSFSGTIAATFVTPVGSSIPTKINVPYYDPGAYGQIIAFGLPSGANATARALTVVDARTAAHQPSIAVLSPNEAQIGGFTWDGSNSDFGITTTSSNLRISNSYGTAVSIIGSTGTQGLEIGKGSSTNGNIQFDNSTNNQWTALQATNVSATYITNLPTVIGSAGQCIEVASIASSTQSLGYANCLTTTTGLQLQGTTPGTAQTGNFNITGTGIAGILQATTFDTASAVALNIGTTNATAINLQQNTVLATGKSLTAAGAISFTQANTADITVVSDLSTGGRTTPVLEISQANHAGNSNTSNLLRLANSDSSSTAAALQISQVSAGKAINVTGISSGTAIDVSGSNLTTGTGVSLDVSTITSGLGISLAGANAGITTAFTGDYIQINPVRTLTSGSFNDSGKFLNLVRASTVNNAGSTYTVSGALANLQSSCTATAGTCTDNATILNLSQQYASASGTVLNVTSAGTGNLAALDVTNSSANGVSIDVQSASTSQYALSVTGNNGATQGLYVRADGKVGIGNAAPAQALDVTGTINASASVLTPLVDVASAGTLGLGTGLATTVAIGGGNTANLNIGTSGNNKTINIGSGGAVNYTTAINIGNTISSGGANTIQIGGTGTTNGSNTGTTVTTQAGQTSLVIANAGAMLQTFTDSSTAFQIQNSAGTTFLSADSIKQLVVTKDLNVGSATTIGGAGRLFSDGFESGNANLWPDVAVSGSSALAVDTTTVNNGKYSYKITNGTGPSYISAPITGGATAMLRNFVYISSASTDIDLGAFGAGANIFALKKNNSNGKLAFSNSVTTTTTDTSTVIGTGAWHKLELDMTINASSGTVTVFLDGVSVLALTGQNTGSSNIDYVYSGDGSSSHTGVVYYDGVVVDTVRPGDSSSLNVSDSLHVSGSSTFGNSVIVQPASNSTQAFQVQNASGVSMLKVDTTNARLYVGPVAGDTVGTILVLGNKTTSGDPTGVEGATYYNSSSKSFRCYQSGAWTSCGPQRVSNTSTTGNTVSGTTSETNFGTNYVIPANDCQPGRSYRITVRGNYSTDNTRTLILKLKMGSTALITSPTYTTVDTASANRSWYAMFNIICDTTGASGTIEAQGNVTLFTTGATVTANLEMLNTATKTIDTTTSQTLQMSAQWGNNAGVSITARQFLVEAMGP